MSWTEGVFYRFYTDKEIGHTYQKMIGLDAEKLGFEHDYSEPE